MSREGSVAGRAAARLRSAGKRVTGRLGRRHSGYFFVATQMFLARLDRVAAKRLAAHAPLPMTLDSPTVRAPRVAYRELEPAEPEPRPPASWTWPRRFPTPCRSYDGTTRGAGAVEIPDGVVFGARGYFGPSPSEVLVDASALWVTEQRDIRARAADAVACGVEELEGITIAAWAGNAGDNYAHCLLQSVPRLDLIRRGFGLEADRFLVTEKAPRTTFDALTKVGVPSERIQLVPRRGAPAYRCEVLRAAVSPLFHELGADWMAQFLNELFVPVPPPPRSRRIYVQRGASRRAVCNEEDVVALLEPSGYEVVTMQGLTTEEQATLFASAEAIVAPHGAALANIIFARPGTTIVELMGRNTASADYARLAWRRGLRYEMVMGIEPAPPDRWWTRQIWADTVADVRALRRCLDQHGFL